MKNPDGRKPRKWRRTRKRLRVKLVHSESFTVDIGKGGFCAELARVLAPGSPVAGTVVVDGRDLPFTGTVAWAKAGDTYLGLRGRMGISFTAGMASEYSNLLGEPGKLSPQGS
jgi:hypothetical protein